ncbi:MAG: PTS sugar transporter subunit IIA [Acidobacteriota bacterium]
MVMLADLMDLRAIEHNLTGAAATDVLETLVARLAAAGAVTDEADAIARLREREQLKSTGIGGGIAIPHAKTPAVSRTRIAFGRSREGIPFDAIDGKPAHLIFLILGPPDSAAEHVRVLSRIAHLVRNPGFLAACDAAEDAQGLYDAVLTHQE